MRKCQKIEASSKREFFWHGERYISRRAELACGANSLQMAGECWLSSQGDMMTKRQWKVPHDHHSKSNYNMFITIISLTSAIVGSSTSFSVGPWRGAWLVNLSNLVACKTSDSTSGLNVTKESLRGKPLKGHLLYGSSDFSASIYCEPGPSYRSGAT